LVAELDCAYIDEYKLAGQNPDDLPVKRWPPARKQWQQSLSATLQVFPADKPIISLVTDSSHDPGPSGGLKIADFYSQANPDGRKKIIIKIAFNQTLPVPISYDVSANFSGKSVKIGHAWISRTANGSSSSGERLEATVDQLGDDIKSADIILTPNPAPIESLPEVSEIWGKEIILHDVKLDRLDLEE
jgi:hypothetical protein